MKAWGLALLRRAIRPRRARVALALLGVAASAILVLVLLGAERGLANGVRAYAGQPGIDVWVAPRGTDNLVRSSGLLSVTMVDVLSRAAEVADAAPVLRGFVSVAGPAKEHPITLLAMGYRGPDGLGGPPDLEVGRRPAGAAEIVLDRAAAARVGARPGDEVTVNERPFTVVGLSRGTNLFATQFVFIDGTEVEKAAGLGGRVSFVALRLREGADAAVVAAAIESDFPTVQAFPRDVFVARNLTEVLAGFRPFLVLITGIGAATATLLVALLVQGAVDERQRDLAVLLALGAPARHLAVAVIGEAALLVVGGVVVGGVAGAALQLGLAWALVTLELAPRAGDVVVVLGLFSAASLVAATLPLVRLRRVDPAEAFRP